MSHPKVCYPEQVVVEKTWGKETWFVNNNKYCGKLIMCRKDEWSSKGQFHYHRIKCETFFVISGSMKLQTRIGGIVDDVILKEGSALQIEPTVQHRFISLTDTCKFIEVSTTHYDEDSYRLD